MRAHGECCRAPRAALGNLRGLAQADSHLLELKKYEDEGDRLVKEAIGSLFDDPNPDPLYVMRWKDVYDALEDALDACETAAHHVGNIVVKNSQPAPSPCGARPSSW